MKYAKLRKKTIAVLFYMCSLLMYQGKSEASSNHQELAGRSHNVATDTSPTIEYEAPHSATQIIPAQQAEHNSFGIAMPKDLLEEQDLELARNELKEKIKQIYISAGATSILAVLTVYYACNTSPSEWVSGTAGSFCANMLLTSMATNFLRNDKNNMLKRLALQKND